jgi:hypothetical protein
MMRPLHKGWHLDQTIRHPRRVFDDLRTHDVMTPIPGIGPRRRQRAARRRKRNQVWNLVKPAALPGLRRLVRSSALANRVAAHSWRVGRWHCTRDQTTGIHQTGRHPDMTVIAPWQDLLIPTMRPTVALPALVLDGFLTGVIVAPRPIPRHRWLAALWRDEDLTLWYAGRATAERDAIVRR